MNAEKVTVKFTVEALHIHSIPELILRASRLIEKEAESGGLEMSDGDCVKWETTRKAVDF